MATPDGWLTPVGKQRNAAASKGLHSEPSPGVDACDRLTKNSGTKRSAAKAQALSFQFHEVFTWQPPNMGLITP
jgi:hypothetical protein